MMETKLWIALCVLLLINLGSTEQGDDRADPSSASKSAPGGEAAPKAPAAESVSGSSPDPISHAVTALSPNGFNTNSSSRGTNSSSSDTTTEGETISMTPEPKKDNDTNTVSPSEAAIPKNNRNLTDQSTSQPPIPLSGSHAPTSHIHLTSTTTSPTPTAHTTPADMLTTIPIIDTSHNATPPLADAITPSNQPTHLKTHSSTSVSHVTTPEPPKPKTTTTTTIAQSSSTSSTSSSQEPENSESQTLTSPQNTSRPDGHPETSSESHPKSTITLASTPSAQAKAQADTPSQLNVGGDTTMVHDSPTLDPLLAGLVSAFIITAVIITLLLFLKLRRRDNRPEFRRLQDLPMDDMMEDTPLSMYSY
ncbi:uncharacterized protein DDB_G0271670-like isoform X2 [Siniperca chuatsi]|uniref:uncharacterized protein DDB_G0271670-like isoform X2 n=1 Tax=Siniperca chuatsi TaxID=119488 RepID=UPI001CE12287|nr:uncharacterized protein DDB_G0271670-like isoform X2 [Siniperca chuatsi]